MNIAKDEYKSKCLIDMIRSYQHFWVGEIPYPNYFYKGARLKGNEPVALQVAMSWIDGLNLLEARKLIDIAANLEAE